MYSLVRHVPKETLLWIQTPAFLISFAIASLFYKLGSFALECVAFLATWFVVDLLISTGRRLLLGRSASEGR